MTVENLIKMFLGNLRLRGLAGGTVKVRKQRLEQFNNYLAGRKITKAGDVTETIARDYVVYINEFKKPDGQKYTVSTRSQIIVSLSLFFSWCLDKGYILANPMADIRPPKAVRALPKNLLSYEEVERILRQPDTVTACGLRDKAILETLYSTGIRRTELLNLQLRDLDSSGLLFIRQGKGGKDRLVPVGKRAMYWLERYLAEARPKLAPAKTNYLFISLEKPNMAAITLTVTVRKYFEKAGIDKKAGCHIFRHSMATHMLEGGAGVRYVQEMLGHSSLKTTQIYTKVTLRGLRRAYDRYYPDLAEAAAL